MRRAICAVAIALAILFAGCGSSDPSGPSEADAEALVTGQVKSATCVKLEDTDRTFSCKAQSRGAGPMQLNVQLNETGTQFVVTQCRKAGSDAGWRRYLDPCEGVR